MKVETYECDVCGKPKKEVNHWWLMANFGGKLQLISWPEPEEYDDINLSWWEFHLCGAECVIKKVNEFMERTRFPLSAYADSIELTSQRERDALKAAENNKTF